MTQWELIFGVRLRCAVALPGYVIQPFEQDLLIGEADAVDCATALEAFEAVRRMTLAFAASLSANQRRQRAVHGERGEIDVEDLLVSLAGHGAHHIRQVQRVM